MEWYLKPWRKYADFTGRARRKEYWTFNLINMALIAPLFYFNLLRSKPSAAIYLLIILLIIPIIVPSYAVAVRRLHDTNRDGSYIMFSLIPFIGFILVTIWTCQNSDIGENDYGPNPKCETVSSK